MKVIIKIITGLLGLIFLPYLGFGQEKILPLMATIPVETRFITTDKLQQLYAITLHNTIIKFTPEGTEQYQYSNNTLGDLSYLDVTDPFNLLLYYKDYQIIITLDRTLNKTGELSLIDANVIQANTVALSNDGNIWIYDEAAFHLKKLSRTGDILVESQNLSLLLPKAPKPAQLLARENWVYASDPTMGILVFNNFGQYAKTIPVPGITNFQMLDNRLIYLENGKLHLYDMTSFRTSTLTLPEGIGAEDQVQVQQNRVFVRKKDSVLVYSWQ